MARKAAQTGISVIVGGLMAANTHHAAGMHASQPTSPRFSARSACNSSLAGRAEAWLRRGSGVAEQIRTGAKAAVVLAGYRA